MIIYQPKTANSPHSDVDKLQRIWPVKSLPVETKNFMNYGPPTPLKATSFSFQVKWLKTAMVLRGSLSSFSCSLTVVHPNAQRRTTDPARRRLRTYTRGTEADSKSWFTNQID